MIFAYGVPSGLFVALVGAILNLFPRFKVIGRLLIGAGMAIAILALILLWANSGG